MRGSVHHLRSIVVTVGLAACVLAVDLLTPQGSADGVIYVVVILASLRVPIPRFTWWVTAVCTLLIPLGLLWSPTPASDSFWSGVSNRLIAVGLVWMTALLSLNRQKLAVSLADANASWELEATRRQQDQARFRHLIESAPIAFVMIDRTGVIKFVNEQAEQLFGRGRAELLEQHYKVLVPERFHALHQEYQAAYFADPQARALGTGQELCAVRKDGTEFPVEVGLTPLATDSGLLVLGAIVDVSERKRAEQALLEEELRTRSILQAALDAAVMIDDAGVVTFWNPQAETMFGYSAAEAVGQPLAELIIPVSFRGVHTEGLRRFLATGKGPILNRRLELPALRRNGEEFPVELTVLPLHLGGRREFSAFARDLTEHHRAEQAIRQTQTRLNHVLEASGAGIWEWNIATGEMLFSDAWLEALGYSREEQAPDVKACERLIHPDDLPRIQTLLQEHFEHRSPAFRCESRILTKAGVYRWTLDVGKVVEWDEQDQPLRMVGSSTDITDRRRANERFRLAVESAPSGMVMVDSDGKIVLVNSETEKLFGYTRDELLGKPVEMLVPAQFRNEHPRLRADFFANPQARVMGAGRELFGVRKDDSEFPIEIGLNPIELEDAVMVLSAIVDITERKRTESRLQELNRTLERRVDERTHLVALLKDVAATCNQAESVEEALGEVLEHVCRYLNWPDAHAFVVAEELAKSTKATELWFSPSESAPLKHAANLRDGWHSSTGPLGQVLKTGQPEWIADTHDFPDANVRDELQSYNIRSLFIMPVTTADQVVAVLEFFSPEPVPVNEELLAIADQLGRLLGRVVERAELQQAVDESVEAEQRRIGQELHDGLGQELTALSFLSRSVAKTLKSEGSAAAESAEQFAQSIPRLVREIRAVIRGLMPVELDADGLMSALQQLADTTEQRHGITCRFDSNRSVTVVNPAVAHHLFRIAQEAINNALKHAHPDSIIVTLRGDKSLLDLSVRDNGTGIVNNHHNHNHEATRRGMGLRIMRHRASLIGADLTIQSPPQGGTIVTCTLPL